MIHILLLGGSRFCWRVFRDSLLTRSATSKKRTLIVGAGSAGTMVARQLLKNHDADLIPVGFIDDDVKKQNLDILGIPVIGGTNQIETLVKEYNVENIVIAIPSLRKKELNKFLRNVQKQKQKRKLFRCLKT